MSYLYRRGAKKKAQKEKQFLSNYTKQLSINDWIKPSNSSLLDSCQRWPGINVLTKPGLSFQQLCQSLSLFFNAEKPSTFGCGPTNIFLGT